MKTFWTILCLLALFIPALHGNVIYATNVKAPLLEGGFLFSLTAGIFPFILIGALAYMIYKGFFVRKTGGRNFS